MAAFSQKQKQGVGGEKFGVAKSTIADIWKDCKKISHSVSASESPAFTKNRCIVHHPKFDLLDEACWNWFCQQHSKGAPVSGVLLQEKMHLFFTKLDANLEGFKGSTEWLTKVTESKHPAARRKPCLLMCLLSVISTQGAGKGDS